MLLILYQSIDANVVILQTGVSLTPVDNSIRIDVSTFGSRIVLKFCENRTAMDLPRGDFMF